MCCILSKKPGRFGDEQVHLRTSFPLLVNLENDRKRLSQRDRREPLQQLRVLRLIPLGSEPIRRSDDELLAFDLERLRRLQPRFESLLWQFLPCPIQQPSPCFLCSQCHNNRASDDSCFVECGKLEGAAKLCARFVISNDISLS